MLWVAAALVYLAVWILIGHCLGLSDRKYNKKEE
jgi:hypothetical protein